MTKETYINKNSLKSTVPGIRLLCGVIGMAELGGFNMRHLHTGMRIREGQELCQGLRLSEQALSYILPSLRPH